MIEDRLVVLHGVHRKWAAKQITKVSDTKLGRERLVVKSYGKETHFRVETIPICNRSDYHAALVRLLDQPYAFLVRGAPLQPPT